MRISICIFSFLSFLTKSFSFQPIIQNRQKLSLPYKSGQRPFINTIFKNKKSLISPVTILTKNLDLQPLQSDFTDGELIGEDAATFSLASQSLEKWGTFLVAVGGIISFLFYVWIYGEGPLLGDQFKLLFESLAGGDTTIAITYMLAFFAVAHSGLASLRPAAEKIVGARVFRYIFALVSLPTALSCIVYFINHRYDGIQLWDLRLQPGMHDFVWWSSLTSFLFLYPSTFNLLEVAAVDKPTLHLWETGITRITRHPQFIGQLIWCVAHTAYIGTSFMCATSAMLCAHHLFAVWNGDRRLKAKFGESADILKETTSVIPFAAIISGKQVLPKDYYKELFRLPYIVIVGASVGAYLAHPYMQAGATLLHW
jgi:zeta-carotene isomerase